MNDEAAKKIVSLLMAAAQAEARKTLPGWVQDNWLSALSDIFQKGLYHAWLAIITNAVHLEADVVEIIDERQSLTDSSVKKDG